MFLTNYQGRLYLFSTVLLTAFLFVTGFIEINLVQPSLDSGKILFLQRTLSTKNLRLRHSTLTAASLISIALSRNPIDGMNDEFGDDSLFADFDLDGAVQQAYADREAKRRRLSTEPVSEEALKQTLSRYFGYSNFRPGQLEVVQALIQKRDVAVFWATGAGKSLCYQIPALHLDKVAVVVSPLISLMQDQVHKLNGLSDKPLAVFLGSAQFDADAESRAMRGDYPVVYVTPEKLNTPNFIAKLSSLASKICLFAIDEAHCVSEWGNDFRKDYRYIGSSLRDQPSLSGIPIVTLTATATERVRQDILSSLRLRDPLQVKRSFDRKNLKIRVIKKKNGISGTFNDLLRLLNSSSSVGSTIVYTPTRAQVDEIANFLQSNVKSGVRIEPYHAGLSPEERSSCHTGFLIGMIDVIVATVAFGKFCCVVLLVEIHRFVVSLIVLFETGMGIDKPDIRRIFHYSPPKTVEEYYQQIGRAGRDGLSAECIMAFSEGDFDRYKSDFYLGNLTPEARKATEASTTRLRKFALDSVSCRRKQLLMYFDEAPPFGDWCGTCDVCVNRKTYGNDTHRNFTPLGAHVALTAIAALQEGSLTNILKVVGGGTVEAYRYQRGQSPSRVQEQIRKLRDEMPKKYPSDYFRELVSALVQKSFVSESTKSRQVSGSRYTNTWTVYNLTVDGSRALHNPTSSIILPVPVFLRQAEKREEERRQRVLAELENKGLKRDKIPEKEIEEGDGDVIRSYSKWHSHVDSARVAGREERVKNLEDLLACVEKWRSETAVKYTMAPASVLPEHLVASIAYATATLPPGLKMEKESIVAAGVRTREVDSLVATLAAWVDKAQPANSSSKPESSTGDAAMVLIETRSNGGKKWEYAVYKPPKKGGLPAWEAAYVRFDKGESPQTIAMTPTGGKKPIQVKTVVGYILDAIVHGRNVDLNRLTTFMTAPTKSEWEQLRAAETATGMNVCGDPEKSGRHGDRFLMTDFLRPIISDRVADTPFKERSEADMELCMKWFDLCKWYLALRRSGYEPAFSE